MRFILIFLFILVGCDSKIVVTDPIAPSLGILSDQTTTKNTFLSGLAFSLTDPDSTSTCAGSVTPNSSDQAIVKNSNLLVTGTVPNCFLSIQPELDAEGVVTITLTASDREVSATTSFNLTVGSTNAAPTISSISAQTIFEDSPLTNLSFNISDAETTLNCGTNVSASSNNQLLVPDNQIIVSGTGENCLLTINPVANSSGVAQITIDVSDGSLSSLRTFSITATPVDDAPVAIAISPIAFSEDTQSVITLSYTDAESDEASSCSLSSLSHVTVTQACACASGACTVGVTGTSNYNGSASFEYIVTANGQSSNSAVASLTINAVDDAPVASNVLPVAMAEDVETSVTLVSNDLEGDLATSCSITNLSHVAITTPCTCSLGSCSVGVTGTSNYNGSASFDYTVTANGQSSNSASASLSISAVDDAPVADHISVPSFNENNQKIVFLSYTDVESDPAAGCSISNLTHLTVTQACACSSGVCSVGVTGALNYAGSASFDYTVTANGLTSAIAKTASMTITAVPATILSVTSGASGIFSQFDGGGDYVFIPISINFSKTVTVTGNPLLGLNVLPATVNANLASGSGSSSLVFTYAVQAGHNVNRLDYASTTALSLNGGTIKDANGTNADLTLPALTTSGLYISNIQIDTLAPASPTNLSWVRSTVYALSATASWTVSTSTDVATQSIQFFSDASCGGAYGSAIEIAPVSLSTSGISFSNFGSSFSYKISLIDNVGNASTSSCSQPLTVAKSVTGKTGSVQIQNESACAIINGGVQCWGKNQYGILGTGNTNATNTPTQVSGLTSGVQAIAVGYYHACAIVNGAAKCWGANTSGQLGDGTTTNRYSPVSVSGLTSGVQAIAAGQFFTCALQNGTVKCWGRNEFGQIGNSTVAVGATSYQTTPIAVSVLGNNVQDIKAFGDNVCALTNSKVYCWGYNLNGQLGNNTTTDSNVPVQVKNSAGSGFLTEVQAISVGGFHSCAIVYSGLQCWGRNAYYNLGDGTNTQRLLPVAATGLTSGVQEVSAGHLHTCVIVDGVPKCWGYGVNGQIGNNLSATQTSPTNVLDSSLASFTGAQSISAGVLGTCANISGSIKCWGYNLNGTLGNGTNTNTTTAAQTTGLTSGLQDFAVGSYHTCAVVSGGVQCWGRNDYGQLGDGTTTNRISPVIAVAAGSGAQSVVVGDYHTCAIVNGGIKCWGLNDKFQISGAATAYYTTPQSFTQTSGATGFTSGVQTIVAGAKFNCVQKSGKIFCWGDNSDGILGVGVLSTPAASPNQITSISQYLIGNSAGSICETHSFGRLYCWGTNNSDPLVNYSYPTLSIYGTNPGFQSFAMSDSHNCVVRSGLAECWGLNSTGALGDGTTLDSQGSQVQVSGLTSGAQAIAVTQNTSCAIVNGAIKCWGSDFGLTPTATSITANAQMIKGNGSRIGNSNTCALINGALYCWGSNSYGQLGDGTTTDRLTTPAQILPWQN
jgi:alpha-tubulin suppressor-like RCC1 family protein